MDIVSLPFGVGRSALCAAFLAGLVACGPEPAAGPTIGGPFELVDSAGLTFSSDALRGKPTLIYFGFTSCPDACPIALQKLALALDLLGEESAARFNTVLISVDPDRDTPEVMGEYVQSAAFPDGLIGLTGSPEALGAAANAFRVSARRIDDPESFSGYVIEHSSIIYLMDEDMTFVTPFTHNSTPSEIAEKLGDYLRQIS